MATNSPVKYESSYKSKDLEKAKFTQYFDDGTNSKETCDKYNGREESVLEVIHYTTERYKRIADKMQWTWREKFDHYEEILDDNAHKHWTTNIIPIFPEHLRNHNGFDMAMTRMMNEFAGGRKARDQIIDEMEGPKCRKPKNVTVQAHLLRLQTMQTLANSVNGIRGEVTDDQLKRIFLKSLPLAWQTNWVNSGREITESHIEEIKEYFGAQKTQADKLDANFNKKNANQANANSYNANKKRANNGSWTNHNRKKRKFTPTQGYTGVSANDCHHRAHTHLAKGHHQWGDCCYNPRGRNFIGEYKGDDKKNDNRNTQRTPATNTRNNHTVEQGNYRNRTWNRNTNNNSNYRQHNAGTRQQEHHYQDDSSVPGNIAISNSTRSQGTSFRPNTNSTNSAMRSQQSNSWTGECHAFDAIAQHPASLKQDATVNLINAAREDVIGPYQTRKGAYNQEDF